MTTVLFQQHPRNAICPVHKQLQLSPKHHRDSAHTTANRQTYPRPKCQFVRTANLSGRHLCKDQVPIDFSGRTKQLQQWTCKQAQTHPPTSGTAAGRQETLSAVSNGRKGHASCPAVVQDEPQTVALVTAATDDNLSCLQPATVNKQPQQ